MPPPERLPVGIHEAGDAVVAATGETKDLALVGKQHERRRPGSRGTSLPGLMPVVTAGIQELSTPSHVVIVVAS